MDEDNKNAHLQFSLQSLLLSFIVVASALSAFKSHGIVAALLILIAIIYIRSSTSKMFARWRTIWILIVGAITCFLYFVEFDESRESSRQSECANNSKQIGLALTNYESMTGRLIPHPNFLGPDGKPWHSWRIYITPLLGRQDIFEAYNFDEPWNGPNNSILAQTIERILQCPSDPSAGNKPITNYLAVIGPDTLWPGDKSIGLKDIPDGADQTILLIEWPRSDINWLEPRDLTVDQLLKELQENPKRFELHGQNRGPLYLPTKGIHVLFADGHIELLPPEYLRENLKAMLTRNGGEPIESYSPQINWSWLISMIILIISTIILIIRPQKWKNQTELQA